jgi:hypothetical protein
MKALILGTLAVVATSTPAFAEPDSNQALVVRGERAICTRVQMRGASRISYQRVCRTSDQWRETLGPDWRQLLNGQDNPEDDIARLEVLSGSNVRGGGVGGFHARGPR